jgi:hypothetical protein
MEATYFWVIVKSGASGESLGVTERLVVVDSCLLVVGSGEIVVVCLENQ